VQLASQEAYNLIKDKIITLELPPSSVIDEHALMEDLGLGRTPIREALQRLSAEGLVNAVPRRGTFVTDISITDLQAISEVRIVLAGFCAQLAAQRVTVEQLAQMKAVLQDLNQVRAGDAKALMDIDRRFQRLLYGASANEFLEDVLDHLYDLSLRLWHLVLPRLGDVRHAIEQHHEIAAALEAGDGVRAEALIRDHIRQFQQRIRTAL
jgi:DNA-binding GntR family transcriptional regulator